MLIPWDRPRGAVHDVEYLNSLSFDRNYLVCLSGRSFYLLLNLANSDAGFLSRYAVEKQDEGYMPCTREHVLYPVVADAIEALGVELVDMSCDIVAVLEEIRDAIKAFNAQSFSATTWTGIRITMMRQAWAVQRGYAFLPMPTHFTGKQPLTNSITNGRWGASPLLEC